MSIKTCPNCRTAVSGEYAFCVNCGARLTSAKNTVKKALAAVGILMPVILIINIFSSFLFPLIFDVISDDVLGLDYGWCELLIVVNYAFSLLMQYALCFIVGVVAFKKKGIVLFASILAAHTASLVFSRISNIIRMILMYIVLVTDMNIGVMGVAGIVISFLAFVLFSFLFVCIAAKKGLLDNEDSISDIAYGDAPVKNKNGIAMLIAALIALVFGTLMQLAAISNDLLNGIGQEIALLFVYSIFVIACFSAGLLIFGKSKNSLAFSFCSLAAYELAVNIPLWLGNAVSEPFGAPLIAEAAKAFSVVLQAAWAVLLTYFALRKEKNNVPYAVGLSDNANEQVTKYI